MEYYKIHHSIFWLLCKFSSKYNFGLKWKGIYCFENCFAISTNLSQRQEEKEERFLCLPTKAHYVNSYKEFLFLIKIQVC